MLPRRNKISQIRRLGLKSKRAIYSKKTYANPFFQRSRKKIIRENNPPNKYRLIMAGVIIIFIAVGWLLFFSSLFKLNTINVSGAEPGINADIENMARAIAENKIIGKNNLLLYDKSALSQAVNEKYFIANLSIKKKLFHTLQINLQLRQRFAVWRENDKYYYIDDQGNIMGQVDVLNISPNDLPLLDNLTGKIIGQGKANANNQTINFTLQLFKEYQNQRHGFAVERFILDQDINTVKMAILGGPKIYFSITEPLEGQVNKLDTIIKEKFKDTFKTKEYIDLRFGGNIYVK